MKWADHNTKTDYEKRLAQAEVRLEIAFHRMANGDGNKAARIRYEQAERNLAQVKRDLGSRN